MDAYRHTLRQPHPAEGRLDLRQAQGAGLIIGIADPVSDTLDMAGNDRIIPHQRDMCGIANVDVAQTGLFKIPTTQKRWPSIMATFVTPAVA